MPATFAERAGGRPRAYGRHPVSFESRLLPMERFVAPLSRVGLAVTARLTQESGNGAKRAVATLLARKPPLP